MQTGISFLGETPHDFELDAAFQDAFGFRQAAEALAEKLCVLEGNFIIGVHGPWGSGKTTYCRLLAKILANRRQTVFHYNAWRHENDAHPLLPLLADMAQDEKVKKWLGNAWDLFLDLASGFKTSVSIDGGVGKATLGFDAGKSIQRLDRDSAHTAQDRFQALYSDTAAFTKQLIALQRSLKRKKRRKLFIFIDDLDRCNPDKAVDLLEQIKLILDMPNCVFVLALNARALDGFIRKRYREDYGNNDFTVNEYIEKLIQLHISTPTPKPEEMRRFIEKSLDRLGAIPESAHEKVVDLTYQGAGANPRSALRILNQIGALAVQTQYRPLRHQTFFEDAIEKALRAAAPQLVEELERCRISRDYVLAMLALGDSAKLEVFAAEFVARARAGSIARLLQLGREDQWRWLEKFGKEGPEEQAISKLLHPDSLKEPRGHLRILALADHYFREIYTRDFTSGCKGLIQLIHSFGKAGDYQSLASFCLSLLELVMQRMGDATQRDSENVGVRDASGLGFQLQNVFWEETDHAVALIDACIELCRIYTEALPATQDYLDLKVFELQLRQWRLGLHPEVEAAEIRLGLQRELYISFYLTARRLLRTALCDTGEMFTLLVNLLDLVNDAYSTTLASRIEPDEASQLKLNVLRRLDQTELDNVAVSMGERKKLLMAEMMKIQKLMDQPSELFQWLESLKRLSPAGLIHEVKVQKKQIRAQFNKPKFEEEHLFFEEQQAYLHRTLQALAVKRPELAVIYNLNFIDSGYEAAASDALAESASGASGGHPESPADVMDSGR